MTRAACSARYATIDLQICQVNNAFLQLVTAAESDGGDEV